MNIILYGFKSSGKTTYGKKVAKKLKKPFVDTDDLIQNQFELNAGIKLPIRVIYEKMGEIAFRGLEMECIESLQNLKNSVIALGGGAILDRRNQQILQSIGTLVYLEASKETIKGRLLEAGLPAFINDEEMFNHIYQKRIAEYDEIESYVVNVDDKSDRDVVNEIIEVINAEQ